MRNLKILVGLSVLAAVSAYAADKPVVVAAVNLKQAAPQVRQVSLSAVSKATRETSIEEGSLEKFGSVGLPQ